MELYNKIDNKYLAALRRPMRKMFVKMEILSHYEGAIGQITNDLSSTEIGTITINKGQGCRRSCSLNIIDREGKYLPQVNSWFWYNRKFKLFIGLQVGEDIYWFPQGVFVTKSVQANGRLLSIEGIDKYGFLNGELNARMCLVEYQASVTNSKKGTKIANLIRETLMLDLGNNIPLDPIEPIIDPIFYDAELYDDIVVDEGGYLGEIFDKLAEMYGANIYYDVNGRLRMERVFNYNLPSWYRHLSPQYDFGEVKITETDMDVAYNYDGVNIVTVTTDNTEGEIYTYTAKNENPQSPVCIDSVGYKGLDGGVYYIPLSDTSVDSGEEKCRQQAEYILLQNTCMGATVSFSYPIIPHLDVDETIYLTNDYYNFEKQLFLIQSITIPLSNSEMDIEATNIQWLPFDTDCISIYCENTHQVVTIAYNTNGGTDISGNPVSYDSTTATPHQLIILKGGNLYNGTKLLSWVDTQGNTYSFGDTYEVPFATDITFTAQWTDGNEVDITSTLEEAQTLTFQSFNNSKSLIKYSDNTIQRNNANSVATYKKTYAAGTHTTTIVNDSNAINNFENSFDKSTTTGIDCSRLNITEISSAFANNATALTNFVFPTNVTSITSADGVLNGCNNLDTVTFPTSYCNIYQADKFLANSTFTNGLTLPYNLCFVSRAETVGDVTTITNNNILLNSSVVGELNINSYSYNTNGCIIHITDKTTSISLNPPPPSNILYLADEGLQGDLSNVTSIIVGVAVNINDTNGFAGNTSASVNLALNFTSNENGTNCIPKNAFNGYSGTSIYFSYKNSANISSEGITLKSGAFCNMSKMTSLPKLSFVKTVPEDCMNNIPLITSTTTNTLENIYGCNNLSGLVSLVPYTSLVKLNGFNNCSKLTTLNFTYATALTEIGGLDGCAVQTLTIPSTVKTVSGFNDCSKLQKVTIGANVSDITGFKNCPKLYSYSVDSSNTIFAVNSGLLYKNTTTLCRVPSTQTSVTIRQGTTSIQSYAIQSPSLNALVIPSSLTILTESCIVSSSITQIVFQSDYNTIEGRYNYSDISGLETLNNITIGTVFAYGNGITDITSSDCLPIRKYCIEHNINYIELNDTLDADGVVAISGLAELRGDE